MAPKRLIFAVAVIAGLLGCATRIAPTAEPVNCGNSGECKVVVHVEGCTVSAPNVDVYTATNIFWELDRVSRGDGWSFPDDPVLKGIWIKDPPQGQFVLPDRQSEWRFKLHDKNEVKGTFRYGVRVVKGSIMCELDPSIVNH
jgi:hypothetical protein